MQLRQGTVSIARTMKQELERRFQSFLDPNDPDFKPIYVVATSLDLRYRIVLSTDQIKLAKDFLRFSCYPQEKVSNHHISVYNRKFI